MDRRIFNRMTGQGTATISPEEAVRPADAGKTVAKVYGYMGLGLLVTAVVAFLVSFGLASILGPAIVAENATEQQLAAAETAYSVYLVLLIVSGIAMIGVTIAMSVMLKRVLSGRSKTNLMVPYLLYATLMGIVMSSLLITGIDFWTIGEAFGITALVFGTMFVIGYYSKANLSSVGLALSGIVATVFLTSFIFFLVALITGNGFLTYTLDIIISIVISIYVVVMVAVEANTMKNMIAAGQMSQAMTIYFAFNMYLDFVYILLRVVRFLAAAKGKH